MIRLVVRGEFRPGMAEQALALYAELAQLSREEDGCHEYAIGRDVEQPDVLAVFEIWRDEAALKAHQQTPHYLRLVPQIGALRLEGHVDKYTPVI